MKVAKVNVEFLDGGRVDVFEGFAVGKDFVELGLHTVANCDGRFDHVHDSLKDYLFLVALKQVYLQVLKLVFIDVF